jgi:hypothetical protein
MEGTLTRDKFRPAILLGNELHPRKLHSPSNLISNILRTNFPYCNQVTKPTGPLAGDGLPHATGPNISNLAGLHEIM